MTVSGEETFYVSGHICGKVERKKNKLKSVTIYCPLGDLTCSCFVYVLIYLFRRRMNHLYMCDSVDETHTIGNIRRAKICY